LIKKFPAKKAEYLLIIEEYSFEITWLIRWYTDSEVQKIVRYRTNIKRGRARRHVTVRRSRKIYRKPVIRKRIVHKPKKVVVRKYAKKINNLKKIVKKSTGPKKRLIRRKILRFRIIKGGRSYVRRYLRRCSIRIRRWRSQIKKNPAQ
jgi:hypothetical protein